jgi:hypothetical protein
VRCRSAAGEESWRPIFAALNLPLVGEFSNTFSRATVNEYLLSAAMPAGVTPIMAEREMARFKEEQRRRKEQLQQQQAQRLEQEKAHGLRLAERRRRALARQEEQRLERERQMDLQLPIEPSGEESAEKTRE